MRLLEAIVEANHRAAGGDKSAGLQPDKFAESLPLIALTCIDVRLNRLFPDILGIREEDFIWLRNAGNIIFDPMSSMTRTLALACAVKGGREIAVIGHTDCRVRATSVSDLIDRFRALGIERSKLPDNLVEFFGLFASERQNVINGVTFVRQSSLIGSQIPVHGLLAEIQTGKLEWIVNGYEMLETAKAQPIASVNISEQNAVEPPAVPKPPQKSQPLGIERGEAAAAQFRQAVSDGQKWLGHVQAARDRDLAPAQTTQANKGIPPPVPTPPPLRRGGDARQS